MAQCLFTMKVRDRDDLDLERLLIRKSLLEDSENRLSLNRIFTTGLPQEEVGRYYARKLLKNPLNQK